MTVPSDSPSCTVVQDDGAPPAPPAPHISFQWKWPSVAKRACATPVMSTLVPVSGANQPGESIAASGGMSPLIARADGRADVGAAPAEVRRPLLV